MATAPLTLVLLGDIMLGRCVNDGFTCAASQKSAAFGSVLPYLHNLDPASTIIAGNLECAVTSHTQPTPKAFNFKLSPRNADVLTQQLRLNFAATANNHVLDYGQAGLAETHEVLDQLGVRHAGSGLQPAAAAPAVVTTPNGHRVAFLAYSDHYQDWEATSTTPGINFIDPASFDPMILQQQVSAARAVGPDVLAVLIHWGPNWRWQPDSSIRALGRAFLEAGADLVFGTSPHHIQGVEVLGGKPIIYSGGSFIDDYSTDDHYRNDLSTIIVAQYGAALGAAPSSLAASSGSGSAATTRSAAAAGAPGSAVTAGRHHQVEAEQQQQQAAAASSAVHTHIPTQARKGDRGTADRTPQLDQGPLPASHSSAAGGASTAAASTGSSSSQGLVLKELVARPIAITHHWRTEGGPFAAAGGGNPPYFSQVNFAQGDDWEWVSTKLQQLSNKLGNTVSDVEEEVVAGSRTGGIRLYRRQGAG